MIKENGLGKVAKDLKKKYMKQKQGMEIILKFRVVKIKETES